MDNNFSNLNTDVGSRVQKSGDTMTGALTLSGDPTNALHPASKQYTDTADNARLQLSGGTMTGKIITVTADAAKASLLLGVGSQDPTTPTAGDVWNNGGAVKIQVGASVKTFAFIDSSITGNAVTASKWLTARTVSLLGDSTGSVSLDGSADASITVSAVRAPKWTTARSISATGDASWSVTVDGSSNQSSAITLASVNGNTGTFGDAITIPQIVTNAKGLITAVTAVTIRSATTTQAGITSLSDSTSTVSSTVAATSTAVKAAYDLANTANGTANTGVSNAATAQSTANTAVSNAATAQSTANTAVSNAATAQSAANAAQTTANAALARSGGTMTGTLILAADPTSALHSATKQYVDNRVQIFNSAGTRLL
jgi:hypothetical protein